MSAISAQSTFDRNEYLTPWIDNQTAYLQALEPEYKNYLDARSARRMSRVVKMGTAAARQVLLKSEIAMPGAIVVGTGLGCSADTEKFLADIIQSDEGLLSPTAFIQSTHNTIAGQIALLLECTAYNFTYTNRGHSFENALRDAMMLINEGEDNVLLGGIDEATPMVYKAFFEMGCVGDKGTENPLPVLGEGASFYLLSQNEENSLARLNDLSTFGRTTPDDLYNKLELFLDNNNTGKADIDMLVLGYNNDPSDRFYAALRKSFDQNIAVSGFKKVSGEYFTSIAFGLQHAVRILTKGSSYPETFISGNLDQKPSKILIYNQYEAFNHTFILVSAS